jgi:MFS family permease
MAGQARNWAWPADVDPAHRDRQRGAAADSSAGRRIRGLSHHRVGTGYLLANVAVIPIVGYLSDGIGSKTIFLLALGAFIAGSELSAVASSVQALSAFRVCQGFVGGRCSLSGWRSPFRLFDPAERAGATSMLMIPILLGPAFGPNAWRLATAATRSSRRKGTS